MLSMLTQMENLELKSIGHQKRTQKDCIYRRVVSTAFNNLPNLRKTAKAKYPNSKYPNYELMRDNGGTNG